MTGKLSEAEAMKRYNLFVKVAAVAAIVLMCYQAWSFFVSSRYQALCGGSYWDLSNKQIQACEEKTGELEK